MSTFDADKDSRSGEADLARRGFLQGAAAGALITGAPWIRKAEAANGVRIRAQSSWHGWLQNFRELERPGQGTDQRRGGCAAVSGRRRGRRLRSAGRGP